MNNSESKRWEKFDSRESFRKHVLRCGGKNCAYLMTTSMAKHFPKITILTFFAVIVDVPDFFFFIGGKM